MALSKAFTAALLLTGSVRNADAAVLHTIECFDFDEESAEDPILEVMKAAIEGGRKTSERRPGESAEACSLLPWELRRVLRLPVDLRFCYVLRVLAGLLRGFAPLC